MKQICKNILRTAAFGLGLAVVLLALTPIIIPKDNREEFGMEDVLANGFLAEADNIIDVAIIGDSEASSTFLPPQLWRDYGITAYIIGTDNQMICESDFYLHRLLKHQQPKLVILEADTLYTSLSKNAVSTFHSVAGRVFPAIRYHNRWKSLRMEDFMTSPDYTQRQMGKGHRYRTKIFASDKSEYMFPTDAIEPIPMVNRLITKHFSQVCRENGIQLMLVSSPNLGNWYMARHNAIVQLAQELDIPCIDMNVLQDEIPIDWTTETMDAGDHLNYSGAVKATNYFGKYLAEHYALPDHRTDEAFAGWQADIDAFYQSIEQ